MVQFGLLRELERIRTAGTGFCILNWRNNDKTAKSTKEERKKKKKWNEFLIEIFRLVRAVWKDGKPLISILLNFNGSVKSNRLKRLSCVLQTWTQSIEWFRPTLQLFFRFFFLLLRILNLSPLLLLRETPVLLLLAATDDDIYTNKKRRKRWFTHSRFFAWPIS